MPVQTYLHLQMLDLLPSSVLYLQTASKPIIMLKNTVRIVFALQCLFVLGIQAQNTGMQYSLGFYKINRDSANYHSAMRDYMLQAEFELPEDSARKRSWIHRKIFSEHFLEYEHPDYAFKLSLLPDMQIGKSSENNLLWQNTRGISIEGRLGDQVFFRSSFYENQTKFPAYLRAFGATAEIVPAQGTIRDYGKSAYDYNYASALIAYIPNKYFNFQLGYDRNFIGDGYRSMLLSDNTFNYPFLKITAGAGRLKYTVMWAQFIDLKTEAFSHDNGYRKKWGVFHYLDWNATDKFSIGLFENVIWQDADSSGKRGFDASYLIPIAFLRPVEFSVGSPDNALMGLNLKYRVSNQSLVYGQFSLDEFKLKEVTSGKGWWGNKFGGQLGFRSINVFNVPKLNFLSELNAARPFTYAQRSSLLAYGHYNQPLAHPLGANFVEWVTIADFQHKRWYLRGQAQYAGYGLDTANTNFGKDIFKSYNTRTSEYGNKISQGIKTNLLYLQGSVAFLLNPKNNLRLEASIAARQETNNIFKNKELIFQIGLRSTFRQLYYDF